MCLLPQTLDGRDTRRQLPLQQLRAQLGLVQQEPALFSRSLRDNIAFGAAAASASMQDVIQAAQQANVHSFVVGLPMVSSTAGFRGP